MSGLSRRVFVLGGKTSKFVGKGHPDFIHKKHPLFGKKENPTIEEWLKSNVNETLQETRVPASMIDKAYVGNFAGELFVQQGHLGAALAGCHPDLVNKPITRVEAACASGGLAFAHAVESIQAGKDICLVSGVEVQTTVSAREGATFLARASHFSRQRSIDDFVFPALFAQRIKAYMTKYPQYSQKDLAHISAKAYSNANKNPLAHMYTVKMTYEQASTSNESNVNFLSNKEIADYLRTADCSQVSDGASSMIIVSEEGLKKLGRKISETIEVKSVGHSTGNLWVDGDLTKLETTRSAAQKAYQEAGVRPDQVQVAEVHDCFSIAEVLMYEALGFAEEGKGIELAKSGATQIDGKIPVNTGGGLIAFGHPVGATGVKQVLEVFRQMKGQCGKYQVSKTPTLGLTSNMGGSDKTVVVGIFENKS